MDMSRFRRQNVPGSIQHLISRVVNREFRIRGRTERSEYLRRSEAAMARTDWTPLGYAVMSNHVHWAHRAGMVGSAAFVRSLHSGYARWLNTHQARLGPVFADRHRSIVFPEEMAQALIAYIHNNPVRAGVVSDPVDSDWTSHRYYVGEATPPPWLDVERGLAVCGFDASPSGRLAFHELVVLRSREPRQPRLSGEGIQESRRRVRAVLRLPAEISDTHVVSDAQSSFDILVPSPIRRAAQRVAVRNLLEATAEVVDVAVAEMASTSRTRRTVRARRLALLVWTRVLNRPQGELAGALGITSSACSQLLGDPGKVGGLESLARCVMDRLLLQHET